MPDSDFKDLTGQVLKGYELRGLIGHGGFGAVYRAYQPAIDREVAIKIILPEYANHPNFIRRFEAEAQMIAHLEHLHIVPLYDYWREPDTACLVMRYLRGGSLQDAIDQRGPWELNAIARLLDQIAGAMTVAHRNNIIHRDLKPANILLDEETNAYLADFGIAKHLVAGEQTPAEDDRFGSPAYISPEQVTGQPVSPQTDIYSLGVVLYMLLTGRTPFFDPSTTTVIRRHLNEPLPPLQTVRPELPHSLNIVIWRATSKRPEGRYPDALALAADFRQVTAQDGSPTTVVSPNPYVPTPRHLSSPSGGQTMIVDLPVAPDNPYKGLRAFEESDAQDFFGRGQLVERLISRLTETADYARFLAVVGPSGSGKSSVVQAGMLPAIRRGALFGSQDWFVVQMMPGGQPLAELAGALMKIAARPQENLIDRLRAGQRGLLEAVDRLLPVEEAQLVLLVDQFEEIFTQTINELERTLFLNNLLTAVTAPESRLRVIITLRADMYDRPLLYPEFGELIRARSEIILPLNTAEMEQAIVGPAERLGVRFEPGLVSEIVADVNQQPGALPLLQYALTELFERRDGYTMTRTAYQETGGVLGALARRADELYDGLDSASKEATRQMFLRLVTLGEGVEDTRRRVLRSELNAIARDRRVVRDVIDAFGKYRLLTFDYEPGTRAPTVEIAHEALIRVWVKLRSWLDTSRDELRLHRRLSLITIDWINARRDPSFLASGSRLAQFESLLTSTTLALNEDESAYLWASVAARQRQSARLRWFIAGLVVFSVVALGLALFAFDRQNAAVREQQRADQEASVSRSRELAVTALTGLQQTDLALLLSLEAVRAADTYEARNSLLTALQMHPRLDQYLNGSADAVRSVAYSRDGRWIASGGRDGLIHLWNASTGQPAGEPLAGHTDRVNAVAISPSSSILASAGEDATIRLWDITTGQPVGDPLVTGDESLWSLAFSPDDSRLAAGSAGGQITLWDVNDRQPVQTLDAHSDIVYALAYSPGGRLLASGGGDNTVRLWDAATGEALLHPLAGHTDWVLSLTFNPEGTYLASTGADSQIIFWEVATGDMLTQFPSDHTNWVRSIAYSPDGRLFATASADNTIRLWDGQSGEPLDGVLTGHQAAVWSIAFSPDSQSLVSAGADSRVILWNTSTDTSLAHMVTQGESSVLAVAYSPNGRQFASAGGNIGGNEQAADNSIHLWDVETGAELQTLSGHSRYVTSLAYSPDGATLASISADGTIRLWDVTSGDSMLMFTLPSRSDLPRLAFSPDNKRLATGGDDGTILLWDVTTGEAIGEPLTGHEDSILSLAFSPDGKILASGSFDTTIRLWNVETGTPLGNSLSGHSDGVTALAFSPDGSILASGSRDASVRLWNAVTGESVRQPLTGHTDRLTGVAFSPDGKTLASSSEDSTVILWNIETGERLGQPLTRHTDWVMALAFSPDGRSLVSGGLDRRVLVWDVGLDSWQAHACHTANRNLSDAEWSRYFEGRPYHTTCTAPE